MPSLLTLLLFCDFLENRLHTSNLVLLRRMLGDFFAGNEHTLQDFIRLGASVVTVMPMGRTRQRHQQEAARLLAQQQQMTGTRTQQPQLYVFRYLSARIATKNIFWLRDMFQEFCRGGDALLCEFVRRGNEVISVIPVDIQALQVNLLPPPSMVKQSMEFAAASEMPRERDLELKQRQDPVSESEEEDDDEIATLAELASVASMPPSLDELCSCIMVVLDRIEEQEPWKRVFNPDTLPLPFSGVKHPKLATALRTFWTRHARAVWERRFWGPLCSMSDRRRYVARKSRQEGARHHFEASVMKLVYQELSVEFFARMDQRTKVHQGWWYLEPVQNLVRLAQRMGLTACLDYMETQAFERFTVVPGWGTDAASCKGKNKSMWAGTIAMQPVLHEICAFKAANKCTESKNKK